MKWPLKISALLIAVCCLACNSKQEGASASKTSGEVQYMELAPPPAMKYKMREEDAQADRQAEAGLDRKLIKEGSVEFETDNLAATRQAVARAIAKNQAYIASEQEFKQNDRISTSITIRMPSERFDNFLADATTGVTKFDNKQISTNDVTEEFLDIQARLKTKKELEARYLELLKKAHTVKDILEIERQIGQLRAEIESIEGRLRYIGNRVSYSTLTLTFYERIPVDQKFDNRFTEGFRNGWENLVMVFVVLTNLWPFLVLGVLAFVGFKIWKWRR